MTNIKVGDEIAFGRFHMGTLISHGFSVVAGVNGHGHVRLENGLVFDKHGIERNVKYSARRLMPVAERQQYLDAQQSRIERLNKISNIKRLVDNLNSNGVDVSSKEQLIKLINSL
jgi:hypothetical protein